MSVHQALAHVLALDQGLHLEPETLEFMAYDDASSSLLVIKGGVMFAYDLSAGVAPGSQEQLKWTYPLQEGPPVLAARVSLDGGLVALQRSQVLLEFVDLSTGNIFVHGSERGRAEVLTFFFTELPEAQVVLATSTGLELCSFVSKRQGLRCVDRLRMPVSWARYTYETRMVMIATGLPGAHYMQAYQFVASGMVTLPPFTPGTLPGASSMPGALTIGSASSTVPVRTASGVTATAHAGSSSRLAPVVGSTGQPGTAPLTQVPPENMRLIKVYGRVYAAHVNTAAWRLELYRFYTDTVVLQHTYELFSTHVDLSVVDNVLVVHHVDSAVAVLVDVAANTMQPITHPLPLALLQEPGVQAEERISASAPASGSGSCNGIGGGFGASGSAASIFSPSSSWLNIGEGDSMGEPSSLLFNTALGTAAAASRAGWYCLPGSLVLSQRRQAVYRLALDLRAVADSCSDVALLVGFLLRRAGSAAGVARGVSGGVLSQGVVVGSSGGSSDSGEEPLPKQLLLGAVKNALQERLPMSTLCQIFDDLSHASAGSARGSATRPHRGVAVPGGPVPCPQQLSPDVLASEVFRWLHDEEVVDALYLQAALSEYMRSAVAAGVALPVYLQQLAVEVLLQQAQEHQVVQLLASQQAHISSEVVELLVGTGRQHHHLHHHPAHTLAPNSSHSTHGHSAMAGARALLPQLGMDVFAAKVAAAVAASAAASPAAAAGGPGSNAAAATTTSGANALGSSVAYGLPASSCATTAAAVSAAARAEAYAARLLASGQILRAAKLVSSQRLRSPTPKELLAAAGSTGRLERLCAVYRLFADELLPAYPKLDLARAQLLHVSAA